MIAPDQHVFLEVDWVQVLLSCLLQALVILVQVLARGGGVFVATEPQHRVVLLLDALYAGLSLDLKRLLTCATNFTDQLGSLIQLVL